MWACLPASDGAVWSPLVRLLSLNIFLFSPSPFKYRHQHLLKSILSSWMSQNYLSCWVASAALENLGRPVHLLSLKHLWAKMLWQDPFFCFSLLPHPYKRLIFSFASFLHDRWHLGEPRAFWWPARLTETWLTREASNSQKCEQYLRCLGFALEACGIYCSSELRWLLDLNNPSFRSSLHLLLVHLRLKGQKPGLRKVVQKHRKL